MTAPRSRLLYRAILTALYGACAGVALTVFVTGQGMSSNVHATFEDMVEGTAARPFVLRALVPWTVRGITSSAEGVAGALGWSEGQGFWATPGNPLFWAVWPSNIGLHLSLEFSIAFSILFACFLGFAFVLRALIRQFYDAPPFVADFAPALALALVPPLFYRYANYLYDPAALLLFTLGMFLIYTRRYALYYPVFLLAAWNKETAILLAGIFLLREVRPSARWVPGLHVLAQLLLFAVVRIGVTAAYRENPGSLLEFHLLDHNLALLWNPLALAALLAAVVPVGILVSRGWGEKPRFLRAALVMVGLPLVGMAVLFGYADELRGYYELYPLVVLLAVPTVMDLFSMAPRQPA
jgi:hypothetical protein